MMRHLIAALVIALAGACSDGDGEGPPGQPNESCCNPAERPGSGGTPLCIEGARCCADGTWACNEGDGSPTCTVCTARDELAICLAIDTPN